jgi:uncharacterized membrane protein YfcA
MEITQAIQIYCIAVLLLAFIGEAVFGFGGGLVSVPLLSILIDVRDAVVLASIFQCLLGALVFFNFKDIAWNLIKPLITGVIVGVIIGSYSLSFLNISILRYLLSLFIFIYLIKVYFSPDFQIKNSNSYIGFLSGVFSGFFQGCLGTGGPNLIIYLKSIIPTQRNFRATIICALSIASFIRIPLFTSAELFTPSILKIALLTFPLFILGVILGQRYHNRIPSQIYFRIIYIFLFVSAVSLVFRNLLDI